jgi:AraC-like DNA-binding protein
MSSVANQAATSITGATHVSVRLLRAVVDILQARGIAAEALLGDDRALLFAEPLEGRLPLSEFRAVFARAVQLAGDPALGLHCGLHAAESSFGLVSPLISHASTLRAALELVIRFHPLLLQGTHLELSERSGVAAVRCEFPLTHPAFDHSLAELILAGLARTLRAFGCAPADVFAVCFEHARPAHHAAYTRAFQGRERFDQLFTGIEFCAAALDRAHIHGNPPLARLLCAEAERTLKQLGQPASCTEQALAIMQRQRQRGHALQMQSVAHELGCSVRSLRRRLQDEDTSYSALEQLLLEAAARDMLQGTKHTFQGIAHALGFAHATAFHRAFKRWTGMTPSAFRSSAR